jgi:branched-chain amino acid transport system substrate-binding protein
MTSKVYRLRFGALAALAALGYAGLSTVPGASQTPAPIVIPVLSAVTGPGSSFGEANVVSVKLAVASINAEGGILGHQVQLDIQDTQTQPTQAAALVHRDAATYLAAIGPNLSNDAKAAFPVAVQEKFPMVSGGVADGKVVAANRPWTFSTLIPAQLLGEDATKTWLKRTNVKTVVFIVNNQDDASTSQATLIQATLEKAGVKVLKNITVASNQPDFSAEVAVVKSLAPDGVVVGNLPLGAASVVKALTANGVNAPVMMTLSSFAPDFLTVAGRDAKNVFTFTEFWSGLPDPAVQKFYAAYEKESQGKIQPSLSAASAYEAVRLLAQAMTKAKVTGLDSNDFPAQRQALLAVLSNTKDFHGVLGNYSIGPDGYRTGTGVYLQITDGRVAQVK